MTASDIAGIHALLAGRRSLRAFDPARQIAPDELALLLEAARWAPSCVNEQPWRFLMWDRHADPAGWARAFACLSEGNRRWAGNAALLLLSVAVPRFAGNGNPNRFAQYDTGAAALAIGLQAVALGLAAHQMGGFDVELARTEFGIPADHTPLAMIAVGIPATPDTLPDDLRARETAARSRRPLHETFFRGRWPD